MSGGAGYVEADAREVCVVCLSEVRPGDWMKVVGPSQMRTGSGMHRECDPEYVEEVDESGGISVGATSFSGGEVGASLSDAGRVQEGCGPDRPGSASFRGGRR